MRAPRGPADAAGTLTAREQALFDLLSGHPGRLFAREEIVERVWGVEFGGDDRVVDVYVKRLRGKLPPGVIETVRGAGYRCPDVPDPGRALPHLGHLSGDAQALLDLWRRLAGAGTPREVLREVRRVLSARLRVAGVALLEEGGAVWETCGEDRVAWAAVGPAAVDPAAGEGSGPRYLPGAGSPPLALLPLLEPGGRPWGLLAAALRPGAGWDEAARAQVEAAAVVAHAALRLGVEAGARRRAEQEVRDLGADLERRVARRTEALARASADHERLAELSRRLEAADSVAGALEVGLPALARLAGTAACAAWVPRRPGPPVCLRADGTPGPPPVAWPPPAARRLGPGGEEPGAGDGLDLYACGPAGVAPEPGRASPLLPAAAGSVARTVARLLYLEALEAAALTDEDTGLSNRAAFLADLGAEVAYSARYGTGFGLGLVDIANIRSLNATVGYAGGNDVILRVAHTLQGTRRAEDRVYRLCGATFAVLLRLPPGDATQRSLVGWRGRLRGALEDLARHVPFPLELSASEVGCPGDARTTSELLRLALAQLRPGFPDQPPAPRRPADVRG